MLIDSPAITSLIRSFFVMHICSPPFLLLLKENTHAIISSSAMAVQLLWSVMYRLFTCSYACCHQQVISMFCLLSVATSQQKFDFLTAMAFIQPLVSHIVQNLPPIPMDSHPIHKEFDLIFLLWNPIFSQNVLCQNV